LAITLVRRLEVAVDSKGDFLVDPRLCAALHVQKRDGLTAGESLVAAILDDVGDGFTEQSQSSSPFVRLCGKGEATEILIMDSLHMTNDGWMELLRADLGAWARAKTAEQKYHTSTRVLHRIAQINQLAEGAHIARLAA